MNSMRKTVLEVLASPALLLALLLSGCDVPGRSSGSSAAVPVAASDTTAPAVESVSPEDREGGLELNTTIRVTFSEPMDPATINGSTFRLLLWDDTPVAGSVACTGSTAVFTPVQPLRMHTLYHAVISGSVSDLAGNRLSEHYEYDWYFSTTNEPSHLFLPVRDFPVGSFPVAVAVGDLNHDGLNDVALLTSFYFDPANDYRIFVFLQNGTGGLDPPVSYPTRGTAVYPPASLALGDVNGDGRTDAVVGLSGYGIEVFLQNASGGLDPGVLHDSHNADKVRIADMNNDGRMDVVGLGNFYPTDKVIDLFLQNADGTLPKQPKTLTVLEGFLKDMNAGDLNSDGRVDIVISGSTLIGASADFIILTQKSDGTFDAPVLLDEGWTSPEGIAISDVNGDGRADLVVTNAVNSPNAAIGIYEQNGSGGLEALRACPAYDMPGPVAVSDLNNDGRNDIITAHSGWQELGVLMQKADGSFETLEEYYPLPYASRYGTQGLAIGDINGDGKPDAVLADYNHGLLVLYHR